jgi:transcriptional regulator with XRE-family HTH domain
MKQPELGKKVSELRKAKGLTQEELVEKCNISVRTIQRIENGDVTPRSYTIKTILAALEYDLSQISVDEEKETTSSPTDWIKKIFFIGIDTNQSPKFLIKQLNIAWIVGLIYFLLGFFESAADYYRAEDKLVLSSTFYIIVKIAVIISFIFFQRGFILLGYIYKNYLLKIVSFVLLFGNILIIGYDIASIFYNSIERQFILGAEALTFGGIGILFGVSLLRLNRSIGKVSLYAGIFEIIASCFFLTIILSFIGYIFLIPAELFEIIILFKASEIIESKNDKNNSEII